MRRITVMLLLIAVCGTAIGQANQNVFRQLDFTLEEIEKMEDIQDASISIIRPAQAEVNVIKQKLTRLMLRSEVDLVEIEKLLRQSLQWELEIRMAQITQQVEIRKVVGDTRWAIMLRAAQILKDPDNARRIESGPLGQRLSDNPNARARVINLLRNLSRG